MHSRQSGIRSRLFKKGKTVARLIGDGLLI
jgi:hypothetical protein